ncbi:hypothetical protein C8F04DRAFT_1253183 [Mycena alexandri]|uniref:Uncharacterized protein n=1 Tax=Mycena alexandri TaxID=1745969 RepID=A0AAD6T8K0_9AGAR|nr:hypothetical protein C8F04DRAFT_1253183 [Mycena alexandri]
MSHSLRLLSSQMSTFWHGSDTLVTNDCASHTPAPPLFTTFFRGSPFIANHCYRTSLWDGFPTYFLLSSALRTWPMKSSVRLHGKDWSDPRAWSQASAENLLLHQSKDVVDFRLGSLQGLFFWLAAVAETGTFHPFNSKGPDLGVFLQELANELPRGSYSPKDQFLFHGINLPPPSPPPIPSSPDTDVEMAGSPGLTPRPVLNNCALLSVNVVHAFRAHILCTSCNPFSRIWTNGDLDGLSGYSFAYWEHTGGGYFVPLVPDLRVSNLAAQSSRTTFSTHDSSSVHKECVAPEEPNAASSGSNRSHSSSKPRPTPRTASPGPSIVVISSDSGDKVPVPRCDKGKQRTKVLLRMEEVIDLASDSTQDLPTGTRKAAHVRDDEDIDMSFCWDTANPSAIDPDAHPGSSHLRQR